MTTIAEDLEKTIDSILENMEKRVFPMQEKVLLQITANSMKETFISMTLVLCESVLLKKIDYFITGTLNEEDYEILKNHFQTQKNLITVMLQEIIKVLYQKEEKLERLERLIDALIQDIYSEKKDFSIINETSKKSAKEEFDNSLYQVDFDAYNAWLEKNSLQDCSYPIAYSIYHDLSYDSYFHIASMEQEKGKSECSKYDGRKICKSQKTT